ncbi:FAD-dependent oxidoreductase [Xanthobacter sp. 91]|uniref:FAD-dependent oxidoreductase n=1 Tax=Xanthobacter sp. 91 TaxID=1117244 RepID=UPI0009DD2467|nr:FAD-dependent oxidoreductase [Xanthobacter sp. 91]
MSQTSAPRPPAHDAMVPERSAAGPKRIIDCDVCVVGGDVAGLVLAADLARRGRDVVLLAMSGPSAAVPSWPLDSVVAPGFPLSTLELSSRVGRDDAQELLILSAQAAEAGLALAERLGVEIGPRGRLTVARAHAAEDLYREHELHHELAPDTTVFVGADDLAALLGTETFAAGLGVVPAERVRTASLVAALEDAARAAGVRFVNVEGALSVDLKGVRKYLDMANQRVRAFQVAVCGPAAFARLGSGVARLPRAPWVSGGFRLPGSNVPYAGIVEEFGLTGLAYHLDGDRLALAAQSALPVMTRVGAARVLRRHAAEVYPVGSGLVEGARARSLPDPGGMPMLYEGERGVWYALAPGAGSLGLDFLAARMIVGAIAERDDRIALLQPFATGGLSGWTGRVARFAAFWHVRLAARLHMEKGAPALAPAQEPDVPAPLPAPSTAGALARRSVASAASASRHAARAALHAASGWASGLATRAASENGRRRRRLPVEPHGELEDEAPPQRR